MDHRFIGLLLFIVLVMASVPLVGGLLSDRGAPPARNPPVQTLELDGDRRIHITARTVQPLMSTRLALYYEAEPAGAEDEGADPAFFGSLPPDREPPRFIMHASSDGSIAAVAAASDPAALLILHDFETGAGWPRHDVTEGQAQLDERGQQLMQRLSGELPDADLRLVGAEGLRPLEELIELAAEPRAATSSN